MMDQTDLWMLGVGAFGLAFYLFALHFEKKGNFHNRLENNDE